MKYLKTLVIFLIRCRLEEATATDHDAMDCFSRIVKRYDSGFNYVLNVIDAERATFFNVLTNLKDYHLATRANALIPDAYRPLFYIIFLGNLNDLEEFIVTNRKRLNWNPRQKVFVYYADNKVNDLFHLAFKHNCINVTVYVEEEKKIYTNYPITERSRCGETLDKELLFDCNDLNQSNTTQTSTLRNRTKFFFHEDNPRGFFATSSSFNLAAISTIDFFPKKLPLTFYGCKIRPLFKVMWPYVIDANRATNPGLDVIVFRAITGALNLTYDVIDHGKRLWGTRMPNGTYSDLYGMLDAHEADLLIGMIIMNESMRYDFEHTRFLYIDDLAFFVPTAGPVENWKNLILLFRVNVWIGLGVAMLAAIFTWWLIAYAQQDVEGYADLATCAFKVWCVIFSSFNRLPKSFLLRFLFVVWSIYAFVMTSTYQSVLIGFLTRGAYDKQIATFDDLAASDIDAGGFYMLRHYFNEPGNEAFAKIDANWKYCTLSQACVRKAAFDRSFAVIKNCRQMNYMLPDHYLDASGRPLVKRLKDTIAQMIVVYHVHRGFLYRDRFDETIARFQSAGIMSKWDRDVQKLRKIVERTAESEPLNVTHLKPALYTLLIGNALAITCFVCEKLFARIERAY